MSGLVYAVWASRGATAARAERRRASARAPAGLRAQRLDERTTDGILGPRRGLLPRGERPQRGVNCARSSLASPSRTAARSSQVSPSRPASAPRSCSDTERLVLEERELPPVERLGERRIAVGEREAREQLACELGAEGIEAGGLARRLRCRDGQHRPDPERPPVQPFEQHGTSGDGSCGGQPDRRDGIGELGRRVGRLGAGLQLALELEHAIAVDLTPEVGREQALGLRPVMGELAGRRRSHPDPTAKLDLGHDGDADERRNRGVGTRGAEERVLELCVRAARTLGRPSRSLRTLRRSRSAARRGPCGRAPAPRTALGPRGRGRRSRLPARAGARRARSWHHRGRRARSRATRRTSARAGGTRRAPVLPAARAPRRRRAGRHLPRAHGRERRTRRDRRRAG